ncbi:MAG: AAA-like domain-containing protein [Candidatus Poribacteria bacterium]|nr:AAA-like domain-containing protein [Candidatus Poribacteria bacterium]
MRRFGTEGRVDPTHHYFVPRTNEIDDFINRVRAGKYIVLFAPRQTGKTTFFRRIIDVLNAGPRAESAVETTSHETFPQSPTFSAAAATFFPIRLDFQVCRNLSAAAFYTYLSKEIRTQIESVFQKHGSMPSLSQFLDATPLTNHISMIDFFRELQRLLPNQRILLMIDEFDGIPQSALSDFLYALRLIYLSDEPRCPHSIGIIGVKSINQRNYDRSVSPFNIQDEFRLPNFTREQVQELIEQYTDEVGQVFAPEVIESIHKQTAGQPVLVNRFAQILTEELDIPKNETITMAHFTAAHTQLLRGQNTNIEHLTTNIRKDPRFENILMRIMARDEGIDFNLRNHIIGELATYGVIKEGTDGMCEILNPIYLYCILQAFKPLVNGLEDEYFPEDTSDGFRDYLAPGNSIDMVSLLDNFQNFIARAGFKILQVPETPQESVGQHLLMAYLDAFVRRIGGMMYIEVQTGRGRMDIIVTHNQRKYIVETKIWRGTHYYQSGKRQLARYLKLEYVTEGFYVVFDHRQVPEPRIETSIVEGVTIHCYVIPVMQETPTSV